MFLITTHDSAFYRRLLISLVWMRMRRKEATRTSKSIWMYSAAWLRLLLTQYTWCASFSIHLHLLLEKGKKWHIVSDTFFFRSWIICMQMCVNEMKRLRLNYQQRQQHWLQLHHKCVWLEAAHWYRSNRSKCNYDWNYPSALSLLFSLYPPRRFRNFCLLYIEQQVLHVWCALCKRHI